MWDSTLKQNARRKDRKRTFNKLASTRPPLGISGVPRFTGSSIEILSGVGKRRERNIGNRRMSLKRGENGSKHIAHVETAVVEAPAGCRSRRKIDFQGDTYYAGVTTAKKEAPTPCKAGKTTSTHSSQLPGIAQRRLVTFVVSASFLCYSKAAR